MNIIIPAKKQSKTKVVSIRMTSTDYTEFNTVAESLNCSISTLLLEICKTRLAAEKELNQLSKGI